MSNEIERCYGIHSSYVSYWMSKKIELETESRDEEEAKLISDHSKPNNLSPHVVSSKSDENCLWITFVALKTLVLG